MLRELLNRTPTPSLPPGSAGPRARRRRRPVAMATAGAARPQVRKRALQSRPRLRAAAGIRGRRRVTRRGRSGVGRWLLGPFRRERPAWVGRAGAWRAAASRRPVLGATRPDGRGRGCQIPAGRARAVPSAVRKTRVSTRVGVWGGGAWERARLPAGPPRRGQPRPLSLVVFWGI